MAIDIRRIHQSETQAWLESLTTSFLECVDTARVAEEVAPLWDYSRVWAAFEATHWSARPGPGQRGWRRWPIFQVVAR